MFSTQKDPNKFTFFNYRVLKNPVINKHLCSTQIINELDSTLPFLFYSFFLGNLIYSHSVDCKQYADDDHLFAPDLFPELLQVLGAQLHLEISPSRLHRHLQLCMFTTELSPHASETCSFSCRHHHPTCHSSQKAGPRLWLQSLPQAPYPTKEQVLKAFPSKYCSKAFLLLNAQHHFPASNPICHVRDSNGFCTSLPASPQNSTLRASICSIRSSGHVSPLQRPRSAPSHRSQSQIPQNGPCFS